MKLCSSDKRYTTAQIKRLRELSFCIVLREKNDRNVKKRQNTQFWGPFYPNLSTKTFHKNWPPPLFSIYSPVKSEKTNEPILRKNLNKRTNERTNAGEIIGSFGETGRSDRSKKQCTSECIDNCSEIFV